MSSVVNLHDPDGPGLNEPAHGVMEELESLVERAKSGEIRGMAIAMVKSNNDGECLVVGEKQTEFSLIGAVTTLQHMLVSATHDE